jgi:hypothetical protein
MAAAFSSPIASCAATIGNAAATFPSIIISRMPRIRCMAMKTVMSCSTMATMPHTTMSSTEMVVASAAQHGRRGDVALAHQLALAERSYSCVNDNAHDQKGDTDDELEQEHWQAGAKGGHNIWGWSGCGHTATPKAITAARAAATGQPG